MKTINQFILERLKLNNQSSINTRAYDIDSINIQNLEELNDKSNKRILSRFLKGKEYSSSLNIHLIDYHKYIHIHRYEEYHQIYFTIVCNGTYDWPDEEEWENKRIEYNELDDRQTMNSLFDGFYDFLKNAIK